MASHILRLERIESALGASRGVCDACKREGLRETPYERCEPEQCNWANQLTSDYVAEFVAGLGKLAPPTPEEWQWLDSIRAAVQEKLRLEREAWTEKKRRIN